MRFITFLSEYGQAGNCAEGLNLLRSVKDQTGSDLAPFADQNVIGAAGGLNIHYLQTFLRLDEWPEQLGWRKAQFMACAKYDYFGIEGSEQFKIGNVERIEASLSPVRDQSIGKYDKVAVMADRIDADISLAISGKGILTYHLDELKLHKIAVHQAIK